MNAGTHSHRIRVRYAETDQMGVAHHAAWVPWFEAARVEWLRARGRSYRQMEADGLFLPVVELSVRYRRPARFDDELDLVTAAEVRPPSRLVMTTTVRRGDEMLGEGVVTLACVGRDGRPVRMPADLTAPTP